MVTAIKKINRVLSLLESEESRERENISKAGTFMLTSERQ